MSDNVAPKPIPNGDSELERVLRELDATEPDEDAEECNTCDGTGERFDPEYGRIVGCDDCMGRGVRL